MKKIIIGVCIFIVIIIFFFRNFGIEIGDITIGRQVNHFITQKSEVKDSPFYKNHFQKDSLIVLNVWATWCKPCIQEIPDLNEVKKEFKDKGVVFLSISVDKDSIELNKFLKGKMFKFKDITNSNKEYIKSILNLLENKETSDNQDYNKVPKTFIIKNQQILTSINGTIDKDELISKINKFNDE